MLRLDRASNTLLRGDTQRFRPSDRTWETVSAPQTGEPIGAVEAVRWLQRESGCPLRVPVGVIGPREASAEQLAIAREVGTGLASMGLAVICGGRQGIMEAVCEGVAKEGGISIGLLPEGDPQSVNPFATIAVATGIGEARNALIARAALCLIAIGDSYGTTSEVALGLQFGKAVLGLSGAARIAGVHQRADARSALEAVAMITLGLFVETT